MALREHMEIRPGGKLFVVYWDYDPERSKEHNTEEDITSHAARNLFRSCKLADGVTLRDVLMLLDSDLIVFDAVLGNWCADLVEEGLRKPAQKAKTDLAYLELYWQVSEWRGAIGGLDLPSFHALDDTGQNYAIELMPVNKLVDLPLKLNKDIKIYNDEDIKPVFESKIESFTLGQILMGIIHELSFFGSPANRDAKAKEFDSRIQDALSQPDEKFRSWDELKETLSRRLKKIDLDEDPS